VKSLGRYLFNSALVLGTLGIMSQIPVGEVGATSSNGTQYLVAITEWGSAMSVVSQVASSWGSSTSQATITGDVKPYITALTLFQKEVEAVRWPAKYKSDVSQLLLAVNKEKNVWKKFENWKGISNKTKFQKDFNSAIDKMSKWAATVALDVGVYPQTKAILKQLTAG